MILNHLYACDALEHFLAADVVLVDRVAEVAELVLDLRQPFPM